MEMKEKKNENKNGQSKYKGNKVKQDDKTQTNSIEQGREK